MSLAELSVAINDVQFAFDSSSHELLTISRIRGVYVDESKNTSRGGQRVVNELASVY